MKGDENEQKAKKLIAQTKEMLTDYSSSLDEAITTWEGTVADAELQPLEKLLVRMSFDQFLKTDEMIQKQAAKALLTRLFIDTDGKVTDEDIEIKQLLLEIGKKVKRCVELVKQIKEKHDV